MQTRNISKYLLHFAITFIAVLAAIFLYKFLDKPTSMTEKMDAHQFDAIRAQANIANGFEIAKRFQTSIDVYWQMNNEMPTNPQPMPNSVAPPINRLSSRGAGTVTMGSPSTLWRRGFTSRK